MTRTPIQNIRIRTLRARVPRTVYIQRRRLREMKRQAYAMGNFKEIARIDKIINFYNNGKRR